MSFHDDSAYMEAFHAGQIPSIDHRDHVRLAWIHLKLDSLGVAADKLTHSLKRFAKEKGKPDIFHATVTWAYVLLIHERMHACSAGEFKDFEANHPDLFMRNPSLLDLYYDADTLASERARNVFVMPK